MGPPLIIKLNPAAAGCGQFAAKPLFVHFKTLSQNINPKSDISKLPTFPALKFGNKNFSKFHFRFT